LLIGRKTFEFVRRQGGGGAMPGMRVFVFSRTLRPSDCPGATLVAEDATRLVARLKEEPGKDLWLFGGGELFKSLLEAGLVDAVEVGVVPVLLGRGIPFLPPTDRRVRLSCTHGEVLPKSGIVMLRYDILREPAKRGRAAKRG